jgi:hypothetical protein
MLNHENGEKAKQIEKKGWGGGKDYWVWSRCSSSEKDLNHWKGQKKF